jgi:predicted nucleic acid-binding protein
MILLDTNVVVDALDKTQAHHAWSKKQIEDAVVAEGGGISVVTLAELCAGARNPEDVEPEVKRLGIIVHDVPAAAAVICGKAYRRYVTARRGSGGSAPPKVPLPDFFIGAQAEIMGWKIATRDQERFKKYFPKVALVTP